MGDRGAANLRDADARGWWMGAGGSEGIQRGLARQGGMHIGTIRSSGPRRFKEAQYRLCMLCWPHCGAADGVAVAGPSPQGGIAELHSRMAPLLQMLHRIGKAQRVPTRLGPYLHGSARALARSRRCRPVLKPLLALSWAVACEPKQLTAARGKR